MNTIIERISYTNAIKKVKKDIKVEFNKCTINYWRNSTREINNRDSAHFFPDLNKIFRKENNDNLNNI